MALKLLKQFLVYFLSNLKIYLVFSTSGKKKATVVQRIPKKSSSRLGPGMVDRNKLQQGIGVETGIHINIWDQGWNV